MRLKQFLLLFMVLMALSGCAITGKTISRTDMPVYETNTPPEILFCPQENCTKRFIEIAKEATTIDCQIYEINIPSIISVLEEKDAKVIIDYENRKSLAKSSLRYRTNRGNQLSHNKFCVFDHKIVWTGSFNPTNSGQNNDNNVLILHSAYLAKNYEVEFNEMWNGSFGRGKQVEYPVVILNGKRIENYFCPEDCTLDSGLGRVLFLINQAKHNITFMTFSFTHDAIGDALIAKHKEGLLVEGVFEKSQNNAYSEYKKLKESGIDVRFDTKKTLMHHKVFVIDNQIVITGSWNPTKGGTESNDENIVILFDPETAEQYSRTFGPLFLLSE